MVVAAMAVLAVMLALALIRPVDHDESQYVAAALLVRGGALPYRDFGWFQTPLQLALWGPLAALFGPLAWPGLRLVNAVLGWTAVVGVARAARVAGAGTGTAFVAACLFGATDVVLFGSSVARNDALPAAALALALIPLIRAARGEGGRGGAMIAGLLLGAAAAAKISYALPALAVGGWALLDPRRRYPVWLALGALPAIALTLALAAQAPQAFLFEVFTFPAKAPAQFYAEIGGSWKLTVAGRTIDAVKFLALGAGLPALAAVAARRPGGAPARLLSLVALAGFAATALTQPTWRQYLLPGLPPLFVLLALAWTVRPPGRAERIAFALFLAAGLVPTIAGMSRGVAMASATRDGVAIRAALDRAGVTDPVFTLAPQILAATGRAPDPRIAAGPFYFRSHDLIDAAHEDRWRLLSAGRFASAPLPAVILIGSTAGDGDYPLNAGLEAVALARGYVRIPLASSRWRLYRRR